MSDLRKAVDGNELSLVYQPKVALARRPAHYVEALVRWHHPIARRRVAPIDFIPFAEQTGYIRAITQWVLAQRDHAVRGVARARACRSTCRSTCRRAT